MDKKKISNIFCTRISMRTFVNVHGGISYPDCGRKIVGFFIRARVKKSESYSVNLHDGFPGKSMKNVPNIRLFSRIYTKKIHLSYFTFDSVIRTAYTYNSIKKNNRFRFVFNSNINQKYIGKVLVHEHS